MMMKGVTDEKGGVAANTPLFKKADSSNQRTPKNLKTSSFSSDDSDFEISDEMDAHFVNSSCIQKKAQPRNSQVQTRSSAKSTVSQAKKILHDIISGKIEEDPALLLWFLVISFADLKNWKVYYNVAFASLVFNSKMTLLSLHSASQVLSQEEATSLSNSLKEWRGSVETTGSITIPNWYCSCSITLGQGGICHCHRIHFILYALNGTGYYQKKARMEIKKADGNVVPIA